MSRATRLFSGVEAFGRSPSFLHFRRVHVRPSSVAFNAIRKRRLSKDVALLKGRIPPKGASRLLHTTSLCAVFGLSYYLLVHQELKLEANQEPPDDFPYEEIKASLRYRSPIAPLTIEQAAEVLRWEQTQSLLRNGSGVLRVDTVRVASNFPVEDELVAIGGADPTGDTKCFLFGVYDGHAGWECSAALREYLLGYVERELLRLSPTTSVAEVAPHHINEALRTAFMSLDRDIFEDAVEALNNPVSLADAMSRLAPAYAGSCALVSFYHCAYQQLSVACTGDSRAVLGRRNDAGEWEATALSVDQTGYNKVEIARIEAEHPGETGIVEKGRVLGFACSRAFGDYSMKWSQELVEKAKSGFFGRFSRKEGFNTPPYFTAEPVITTTKIQPEKRDFVVMASDGLWDKLSTEQVVNLVGRWLEMHDPSKDIAPPDLARAPSVFTPPASSRTSGGQLPEQREGYRYSQSADERHFVVADDNAATHLVRNALGGGNEEMVCGMLGVGPPRQRYLRDDISIQVIFFGDEDDTIRNY